MPSSRLRQRLQPRDLGLVELFCELRHPARVRPGKPLPQLGAAHLEPLVANAGRRSSSAAWWWSERSAGLAHTRAAEALPGLDEGRPRTYLDTIIGYKIFSHWYRRTLGSVADYITDTVLHRALSDPHRRIRTKYR
eukprot:SAG31_NODE_3320_length_4418_cov_5.799259_2_plen_136_part_00